MEKKQEHYFNISKQIGISYFFSVLIIIFQPLLTILLTRVLSVEEYGVYSLLFVTVSLLSVIFRFGVAEYIKTKIPGLKYDERVRTSVTLFAYSIVFFLIMAAILYIFRNGIINMLKINNYPFIWLISILLVVFIASYEIIDSYLLSVKRIFVKSLLGFLIKSIWVIPLLLLLIVKSKFSLNQVFVLWSFGVIFTLMIAIYSIKKDIGYFLRNSMKFDFDKLVIALRFSLPLILVIIFRWVIEVSGIYAINYFLGKSEVAMYSLAYGLVSTIITVPAILHVVLQPYFAERWNLSKNPSMFFNVMLKYTFMSILPSIVGMFVLREEIILLLSGPKYIMAVPIIMVLLLFPLFSALSEIFYRTMLLRDMIKQTVFMYFITAAVNILFNILFIPRIGAIAAAYSIVISYLLMLSILMYYKPRSISLNLGYLRITRIIIASAVMGIVIMPINPIQYWSKIMVIVLGAGVYCLLLWVLKVLSKEEKEMIMLVYSKVKALF